MAIKDIGKTDKLEDLEPGRLIDTTGTCKYCHNLVTIKADPKATDKEKNDIASAECGCKDGKDARTVETSVRVVTNKINEKYKYMPEDARRALISCLKPVAYGMLDKVSVKVDENVSIRIYRSTAGLNLKRTTKQDDTIDETS